MISGSLASPKPPEGGEPEERGDEKNEPESRVIFQVQVTLVAVKGDKTQEELGEQFSSSVSYFTEGWALAEDPKHLLRNLRVAFSFDIRHTDIWNKNLSIVST